MLLPSQSLDLVQQLLMLTFLPCNVSHQDLSLELVMVHACLLERSELLWRFRGLVSWV